MTASDNTHAHDEDSVLLSKEQTKREHEEDPANNETKRDKPEAIAEEESAKEMIKDEEQVDPYAQQKAESIAAMDNITRLVVKIEETVARHKTKAECLKLGSENPLVFDQQLHHAAKANRYDTGMSSEYLMKHLMQLDNCLSYGCATIRSSRKALVRRIKQIMAQADSLSQQWLKRAQVFEKLKAQLPSCVCPTKTNDMVDTEAGDQPIAMAEEKARGSVCEGSVDAHADSAMDVDEIYEDAATSSNTGESVDERSADTHAGSALEMDVDEISDDAMDEDATTSSNNKPPSPCTSEGHTETEQSESASLPPWQPRTQMYHNDSHVVVAAFVPGLSMEQFNIMIDGTDLVVKAKKQPTMRDVLAYRRGREQIFGNLNLKISLPTDIMHTEGATATYEDGILRLKFIKKQIRQHYRRPVPRQHYRQPMQYRQPMHHRQPTRRRFFNNPMSFW